MLVAFMYRYLQLQLQTFRYCAVKLGYASNSDGSQDVATRIKRWSSSGVVALVVMGTAGNLTALAGLATTSARVLCFFSVVLGALLLPALRATLGQLPIAIRERAANMPAGPNKDQVERVADRMELSYAVP